MSYEYDEVLEAFFEEMSKEKIHLDSIKHLGIRRIKKIAYEGLRTATEEEFSHLFLCPQCKTSWYGFYLGKKADHQSHILGKE